MRISPISLNYVNYGRKNQSFSGVAREVSKSFIKSGSFGGEQGDYNEYKRIIEYRPYADETEEEIQKNIKQFDKVDIETPPPYTYPMSYTVYPDSDVTYTEVVIGEPLHCTKEEAALITSQALRKTKI